MTRIEVTEAELSLLTDLVEAHRHEVRALVLKDSKLSCLLTRSDGLMEKVRAAKLRRDPTKRSEQR